ncbi:hypothetical protein ACFXHA_08705 [Nocardia sp. NPDC059240]|uniref:hypothetical protein n=1 Tax=Nocardia sp. NPDC059240 TaxID=3346786 RepID=UPI0036BEF5A4
MTYFALGYWVPGLALMLSTVSAAVALACLRHARHTDSTRVLLLWQFAAGGAFGGVGAAMSLCICLLGVEVSGSRIRYDLGTLNICSALSGFSVMLALIIAGATPRGIRLALAAVVMGAGLTGVTVLAFASIRIQGHVEYVPWTIAVAFVIATAISFTLLALGPTSTSSVRDAALAAGYGIAMLAVYYCGLFGLHAVVSTAARPPVGTDMAVVLIRFLIIATPSLSVPITATLGAPDRKPRPEPAWYAPIPREPA